MVEKCKWSVLIADDDEGTISLLKFRFELADFCVFTALNGDEAIRIYERELNAGNVIPFCVLDFEMPIIKGDVAAVSIIEMCREKSVIPPEIVIFTGSTDANLMLRLQTAEIGIALIKPQGLKQLEKILNRFVGEDKAEYIFGDAPANKDARSTSFWIN